MLWPIFIAKTGGQKRRRLLYYRITGFLQQLLRDAMSSFDRSHSQATESLQIIKQEQKRPWPQHFIPQVGTKILFPDCRQIGISYCRILLNDTMLNDDSYRTGTSDTPVCECASTVEHFLIRCPRYKQFRSDLISIVQEIGTSSKSKSHLYLSTNLLMAPCWDANLSKKENKLPPRKHSSTC